MLKIFSVYDEKGQTFNTPFVQLQIGQALRGFQDAVGNPESSISKHPEDYHLYHIGEFDEFSARIESFPEPRLLARGSEYSVKK